ncbi:MAG TPA: MarR family winged helix-turn-helix transcriptional regulator [Candidatus Aquabacterium excrementipullorum]|nr:MarR family winged helix-turn-helix transcriptional regulator [Candidatus Aquabacterium excrementipullorum]
MTNAPAASPDQSPHEPIKPSATRVLRQFRVVFNAVKTHFQQVEKQAGIGGAQVWALSVVQANPGIGVGELARAMDIHQSTASNLVKSLVSRQLLGTTRDEQDRRAVRLSVSEAGLAVLASAPAPFAGVLPDALNALDEVTLARLDNDLEQLITVLGGDAGAAQTPLAPL